MGWKGTMRSIRAEVRRAEKRQAQYEKLQRIEEAENLVEEQREYLDRMISYHKRSVEKSDWQTPSQAPSPTVPILRHDFETKAQKNYDEYIPNFLIRFFKLENWRRGQLFKEIAKGADKDKKINDNNAVEYQSISNDLILLIFKKSKSRNTKTRVKRV